MFAESKNITFHRPAISKDQRNSAYGHKSAVIWFTGLSASGKSSLAMKLEERLFETNIKTYVLDGDNIRYGLNKDLGFSEADRKENIRRIGEVSKLFVDAGVIVLTAFISPYREDREMVRRLFAPGEFIEVYVNCPISVCEQRDPKGLYKKARGGEIQNFTGISAPYEEPLNPEILIESDTQTVSESINRIIDILLDSEIIYGIKGKEN